MKLFTVLTFIISVSTIGFVSADDQVEIRLVDDIDETRGYCLDIAGGKGADAPVERGLQAHTCYDYTGMLLEDQSFDSKLIHNGLFKITYFDVCMVAEKSESGAALLLESCEENDLTLFSLEDNGRLVLKSNSNLCVTVSATEKREGRGATPVHVMRPITLEECESALSNYQVWSKFSF